MNKALKIIIPLVVLIAVVLIGKNIFSSSTSANKGLIGTNSAVLKQKDLNKTYTFPLKDASGKELGSFTYSLLSAEIRNEIVVKGSKATAIPGRTFLIINLKLVNDGNQGITVNTRDYVRLVVNNKDKELLAPDVHNDPIEVQPISTKYTRIGFAINDTDKNLTLLVGELEGAKDKILINF